MKDMGWGHDGPGRPFGNSVYLRQILEEPTWIRPDGNHIHYVRLCDLGATWKRVN